MSSTRVPGVTGIEPETAPVCRGPAGVYSDDEAMCVAELPGPVGVVDSGEEQQSAAPAHAMTMLCLDTASLAGFIRSVALSRATQSHTKLKWVEYKDSNVLNFIYTVMPWKGTPGWVEVNTGVQSEVKRDAAKHVSQYQNIAMKKMAEGPQSLARYLQSLDEIRTFNLRAVQETFADASSLNAQVLGETRDGIRTLAAIKLVADVTIAVAAPFVVDLAYSVITTGIKEVSDGQRVDAVAFKEATVAGKELTEETMDVISKQWGQQGAEIGEEVAELEDKIAERQDVLARKVKKGKKGAYTVRKSIRQLKENAGMAQDKLGKALRKQKIFKGLKFGFVAWDVLEAVSDFKETWTSDE
jgi:hypothetical protein